MLSFNTQKCTCNYPVLSLHTVFKTKYLKTKNTEELTKAAEPIAQTDLEVKTSNMRKTVIFIQTRIIYSQSNCHQIHIIILFPFRYHGTVNLKLQHPLCK